MFFLWPDRSHLVRRELTKVSQLPRSPCWGCKYKKLNGKLQQNISKGPWWKQVIAWYVPSHHRFWSLVNGILSRKCQAPRSSWEAHRRTQCWNRKTPACTVCSKAHKGPPHVLGKRHNAHPPSSHTHSSTWGLQTFIPYFEFSNLQ